MKEVMRYFVGGLVDSAINPTCKFVAVVDFDRVAAERDALQLRLNAADQRIDELTAQRAPAAFPGYPPVNPDRQQSFTEQFIEDHLGKLPPKS